MSISQEELEELKDLTRRPAYEDTIDVLAKSVPSLIAEIERLRDALAEIDGLEMGRGDGAVGDYVEDVHALARSALTGERRT
jgi:hypothetical protein